MTLYLSQEAVRKQLDEFAEQLTVDESLTPVGVHVARINDTRVMVILTFRNNKLLNLKMRS